MAFHFLFSSIFVVALLSLYLYYLLPKRNELDRVVLIFLTLVFLQISYAFTFRELLSGYKYVDKGAPFGLVYGPLFYLSFLVSKGSRLSIKQAALHLTPFAIALVFYFLFLFSLDFRLAYTKQYYFILYSGLAVTWICYPIAVLIKSDKQGGIYNLLYKYGIVVFFVLAAFLLPLLLSAVLSKGQVSASSSSLLIYLCMLLSVLLAYFYLLQRFKEKVIATAPVGLLLDNIPQQLVIKQQASRALTPAMIHAIERYMAKRPYLKKDFRMETMASELKLPKYIVSQYFIDVHTEGFVRSINEMRVDYAREMLKDKKMVYTMEELAEMCGFNSRASFYRNFGNHENCTPLEYREKYLQKAS